MTARCPHCKQIWRESYFGYMFGPRKAQIMKELVLAGNQGRHAEMLRLKCGGIALKTLAAHIWQINQVMDDWRIMRSNDGYMIVHVPSAAALARKARMEEARNAGRLRQSFDH